MRLYYSPTSPYVRKVMVVLHETGLMPEVDLLSIATTPVDPDAAIIGANPLGKVPALEIEDGTVLYDSRVICRYLDDRSERGLYPAGAALWPALTLEATADGILDASVLMVYENRIRPEEARHIPWVEGQWEKVARSLDMLEARWMPHLNGTPDMGHFATACALSYLDFRHPSRQWRAAHPHLAAWEAEFSALPSMQTTLPVAT